MVVNDVDVHLGSLSDSTAAKYEGDWDLAVVDLFLKEGSGLGVLMRCRERAAHQRVVMLTNYATTDIRHRCLALGADAVFDKSTELDALFDFCAALEATKLL